MGTHKICVAVNNGAPHQNARCDRTWAAVCGRSTTARVSAIGAAVKGNSEVRFWCRIKSGGQGRSPGRVTPPRNAGRHGGFRAFYADL